MPGFDCVKIGQYVYKDRAEFHGCHSCESVRYATMRGASSRNLWRNEVDSETYCPVRRRQRVHFRQLNVAIAGMIAVNSGIRHGILPLQTACGVGACGDNASNGAIVRRYANGGIYERNTRLREGRVDDVLTALETIGIHRMKLAEARKA